MQQYSRAVFNASAELRRDWEVVLVGPEMELPEGRLEPLAEKPFQPNWTVQPEYLEMLEKPAATKKRIQEKAVSVARNEFRTEPRRVQGRIQEAAHHPHRGWRHLRILEPVEIMFAQGEWVRTGWTPIDI